MRWSVNDVEVVNFDKDDLTRNISFSTSVIHAGHAASNSYPGIGFLLFCGTILK